MKKNILAALEPKLSARLTKTEVTRTIADHLGHAVFDAGNYDIYVTNTKQSRDNITIECTDGSVITLTVEVK